MLFCCICIKKVSAQNPTLGIGLESLTMNKGTIDVKVLTEIIMEKQKELKQEALKRFMLKLFPETNYTTKFYVQNCLTILLNEKNPQVIEKEILELTTNYALVLGIAAAYHNMHLDDNIAKYFVENKNHISAYRFKNAISHQIIPSNRLKYINERLSRTDSIIDSLLNKNSTDKAALDLEVKRKRLDRRSKRKQIEENIDLRQKPSVETFPFGLLCDVVASSLSEMPELRDKGFFKKAINYKEDNFYKGLSNPIERRFRGKLDTLQNEVRETVRPYIVSYDVIKAFFKNKLDQQGGATIKATLISSYSSKFLEIAGGIDSISKIIPEGQKFGEFVKSGMKPVKELGDLQFKLQQFVTTLKALKKELKGQQELTPGDSTKIDSAGKAAYQLEKAKYDLEYAKLKGSISNLQAIAKQFYDSVRIVKIKDKPIEQLISYAVNDTLVVENLIKGIELQTTTVGTLLVDSALSLIMKGNLHDAFLSDVLYKMSKLQGFTLTSANAVNNTELEKYSQNLSEFFIKLSKFSQQESISLKDINYIDDEIIPHFIKYTILFPGDRTQLSKNIRQFQLLSTLLKIKAITDVGEIRTYKKELINLFGFISNLDNLDKAESYQFILNLMQSTDQHLEQNLEEGKFKEVYLLFTNAIKKYTLINTNEQYVSIDVVSFLTEMQQYFDRNNTSRFGLYLTLGLSQNFFISPVTLPEDIRINNVGFASEKLGLKFRLHSFNRYRGYENAIKTDINLNKRAPFINEIYFIAYGSGLLYSIANTATETKFDYAHAGGGFGLRFYNSLDLNLVAGFPFIKGQSPWKNAFWGIGLDIPLGEYLEKLGSKK